MALPAQLAGGLNGLQGARVALIEIKGPSIEHPEWLEPLLLQKANEPLDKYKVRRSVQALYDTGKFAEIQVEAQRNPQGEINLTFSARENFFFGSIRVEGAPNPPTDNQLVNASKLVLGEQFTDEKIKTAIEGMQRSLQDDGYFKAGIRPFYEWDSRNQEVKVLFAVDKGTPARVGAVLLTGSPGITDEEVRDTAGFHSGDRVSAARLTRALGRLRKLYQKSGRLEAQVTVSSRIYRPQTNTVDYTFDIVNGPQVEVRVEGAKLSTRLIKKLVPVYEENAVDEDLLNEGARNIRDYFQTQGYFDVNVTFTQEDQAGSNRRDIVYQIDAKARHKFMALVIRGNKYFRREDIRERMAIQPAGGLVLWGLFSQSLLARDIEAIRNLYQSNGFLQVKVEPEVQDNYEGQKGQLQVTLTITEGPQSTVGKLTVEGNSAVSLDEIRNLIAATEGQPYSDATVINDQTEVMDAYFNRGFSNVRFDYSTQAEPDDPTKIDVTYKITEGRQVFVDKVLIAGLHFTRPSVVEHQMRIKPDGPISQEQMLDTQRRLYDMGIFNEVNMAVQNPDGDATHKNVNFQISEAKRYTFNYGAGLQVQTGQPDNSNPQGSTGVSPNVSFVVTRQNFRGRDHMVTLRTRYGNLEKLALITYEAPRLFDSENLNLDFNTFYEQTNNVKTYTAKRLEGSVELKQSLDRATTLLYRAIYRRVSTTNLQIDPNLVPLFSQPVRVGMPDFSYARNTRDSDIESHKGTFSTFDLGVASSVFGSETNFVRVTVQNSSYHQFYKRRWVFARSTRVGAEEPFAGTSAAIAAPGPGALPPSSFIPLPERFLAGGSTTHRGFGINQAGPRDLSTGFQLGGEAMFLNNLELRTPPLPFPWVGNNLSAVLFNDVGNVFTTPIDMVHNLLRFTQKDRDACLNPAAPQNCSFNYTSVALGAGIRYRTPLGPISFDLGYNMNPPAFPIATPSDGSAPRSEVLRHFNFFFNIGQTF